MASWIGALAAALERPLVVREPRRPLDAIVVLGAPLGPGGALTPILEERIAAAAALWRAGGALLVGVSGGVTAPVTSPASGRGCRSGCLAPPGSGSAPRAEADALAEGLRAHGVPVAFVERASRTTAENARETAPLLAAHGARSAWLVTQPFHGRRAARLFRAAGVDAHAWHIDDSIEYRDRPRALRWLLREYAAWLKLGVRDAARAARGRSAPGRSA